MPVGKCLPQVVSRYSLDGLHQAVNAEVRITADKPMHVIWQHFQLHEGLPPAFNQLCKLLLEPSSDAIDQHFVSVLGAKYEVVMASGDTISSALTSCPYAQSMAENRRYVNGN
jgi:hypothetical protein